MSTLITRKLNPTEIGRDMAKTEYGYDVSGANTILSPGKFEGEHVSTIYFYDAYLDGDGTFIDDKTHVFDLTESESKHFDGAEQFILFFDDAGFVYGDYK